MACRTKSIIAIQVKRNGTAHPVPSRRLPPRPALRHCDERHGSALAWRLRDAEFSRVTMAGVHRFGANGADATGEISRSASNRVVVRSGLKKIAVSDPRDI
jgi:hypothetical protein